MNRTQPDLEALYQRRDDIFAGLLAGTADLGDCAEYERLSAIIRATLCDRLDAYLDAHREAYSPTVTIDLAACDAWAESYAARDYLPTSEE